jgi:NHL repeat
MRVSLAPTHLKAPPGSGHESAACVSFLAAAGPRVVLGDDSGPDGLAVPIRPSATSLFGPRGACLGGDDGPLIVCDSGHHRLLVWRYAPKTDHAPADVVIGQPDFASEGRNARGDVGAATLNVPTGIAAAGGVLAVADAWNHRVLIWHGYPERSNQPADVVLGQADFRSAEANRGADVPAADTLFWCYGVAIAGERLFVADTGNRRVLVWDRMPTANGAPADLVLGQRDFTTRDENAGGDACGLGMRWPHGIAVADGMVLVADAGNNRVMAWRDLPRVPGRPCSFVLGQADVHGLDHNRAAYFPTAGAMNMPYGIAVQGERLVVADTANSRLLAFDITALAMGLPATSVAGQFGFTAKGDNRWAPAARDSLCWPYNVAARGDTLVIADSGNNRVLLWETAP